RAALLCRRGAQPAWCSAAFEDLLRGRNSSPSSPAYRNVSEDWRRGRGMWVFGGIFGMCAQCSGCKKAQHRRDYDEVTVLSEENCMGRERSEQRKLRPT